MLILYFIFHKMTLKSNIKRKNFVGTYALNASLTTS